MLSILYQKLIKLLSWFVGELDELFWSLCIFIIVDILTLSILSHINKNNIFIDKNILYKKISIFFVVGLSHVVDLYFVDFINGFRTITIFFYIICEAIFILDNIAKLGVPVPTSLTNFLKKLKEENDKKSN